MKIFIYISAVENIFNILIFNLVLSQDSNLHLPKDERMSYVLGNGRGFVNNVIQYRWLERTSGMILNVNVKILDTTYVP